MIKKKSTAELVNERPTPADLATMPRTPISIVVDNVRSLDNVGLIFRLCETARIGKLYLTGYTGHPKIENDDRPQWMIERHEHRITKTAVYAVPHQPWEYHEDAVSLVKELKNQGHTIYSLEQTDRSVPYHRLLDADYKLPATLIVGHERQGVRQELLDISDHILELPILGLGNSHNVATATGILIYHLLDKTKQI